MWKNFVEKNSLGTFSCDLRSEVLYKFNCYNVNMQVATKRLELLAHFFPDLIRAQSLVHVSNPWR